MHKAQLDHSDPLDQSFWVVRWKQWEKRFQTGLSKEFTVAERWDKLAKDYSRKWAQADPMRDRMLGLLKENNVIRRGMKILDLGCGTGRFAIPFARMGAQVTAVDVSEGMLRYLKEETPAELASLITPLRLDWPEADLGELRSGFDLSFAHMTPAISGPETFLKFLSTSRQWCALVAWSGERRHNTIYEVWRHLTGKKLGKDVGDLIFPFNLLYALGYRPSVEFQHHRHESRVEPLKEADLLADLFHRHLDGSKEEIRAKILSFLQGMAQEDGKINKVLTGCVGRMIWQVCGYVD